MSKHQKVSYVFAGTTFARARKVTFGETFLTVAEAKVAVQKTDFGRPVRTQYRNSKDGGPCEYVNCSNSRSYNGGVSGRQHLVAAKLTA